MELQFIKDKIITLRGQQVILDAEVAFLYGVETKRINEAVKNNPDKFPKGYIIQLDAEEAKVLRSKISTLEPGKGHYSKYAMRAFSEKGLYMLATIIKSPVATETTIAIVEAFAKVRELSHTIASLSEQGDKEKQKSMMQRSGDLITDILSDDFQTTDTDTTIEFNLSVLKVKHTVKRKAKEQSNGNTSHSK